MELPHIGDNCALKQCNQLDFLPVKCDACSKVFCLEHYRYEKHDCHTAKNKDFQVPVCPLCMEPVVGKRDQLPDLAVSQHIDQFCPKNELLKNYQRQRKNTNLQACTFKSCKQKDLIYLECNDCKAKFCIKHRHPTDHSCAGPVSSVGTSISSNWNSLKDTCTSNASSSYSMIKHKAQQITKSGQAALNRIAASTNGLQSNIRASSSNQRASAVSNLQGNLSEQEALAIAMRESTTNDGLGTSDRPIVIEDDEDAALARAIHESEVEARNRPRTATDGPGSRKDTCILS